MDIQTLGFVLSNTRLDIRFDFLLDTPLFSGLFGTFFNDFLNISLCLGLFNNPLRATDSCTRLPFFSNISSLASITDCEALISSISLGKTLSISDTSFFCFKFDFLYSITASVCSLISWGSTPFLKSLVQADFLIEWFLKFPSTPPLHHVFNVPPQVFLPTDLFVYQ